MKRVFLRIIVFSLLLFGWISLTVAQCPMCKAAVESESGVGGSTVNTAKGLNTGILYLFVLPYLCIGFVALMVFIHYKKKKAKDALLETNGLTP